MVRERRNRPQHPPPTSTPQATRHSQAFGQSNTCFRGLFFWVVLLALLAFLPERPLHNNAPLLPDEPTRTQPENRDLASVQEFVVPSQLREETNEHVFPNVKLQTRGTSLCRAKNALVVLAQKKHLTYGRDSLGLLVKALDLFRDNYLLLNKHHENVDLFLLHTGDFDTKDLLFLEQRLSLPGIVRLVNLNNTSYWSLPKVLEHDNPMKWKGSEIYPLGYRHMCRFFGLKLWHFFDDLNQQSGCLYGTIARLDEDSFVLSPIDYDLFDLMKTQQYVYGYRMCAFELAETMPKIWFKRWRLKHNATAHRWIDLKLCGFYTNFFVADLQFFLSPPVTTILQEIDHKGFYYRQRFGDLLTHTLAVYAAAPPTQIHRFLDFTYQHATIDHFKDAEKECLSWGGIQAGYNDPKGDQIVDQFYDTHVVQKDCPTANLTYIAQEDLSPTYARIPDAVRRKLQGKKIALKTVHAGKVEVPGQGILSG